MKALIVATALVAAIVAPAKKVDTYKVDTEKSTINWTGRKVTGEHHGNIKVGSGVLTADGKSVKTGSFNIDMSSLTVNDLQGEMKGKLESHLKADDFFGVEKNPTATFTITKVTPAGGNKVNISGNLKIKGKTAPVTFPAEVSVNGNTLTAKAGSVKVDRTKYDIKYGSKSFFDNLGDKAISDEFELSINLVATK